MFSFVTLPPNHLSNSRSFALGDVDIDNIDAKFENGILNITVPKKEIQENKKYIEVK